MSEVSQSIDQVVRHGLHGVLKARGFKKKGRTFRRSGEGVIQVVNIQGSTTNLGDCGRFTMNLGVYFPSVARLAGTETESPLAHECTLQSRIGHLMSSRRDHWWGLDAATDIESLAVEVADAYRCFGDEWLTAHSDIEHAVTSKRYATTPMTRAALLFAANQPDAAIQLMRSSLAKSKTAKSGWFSFASAAGLESEFKAALEE